MNTYSCRYAFAPHECEKQSNTKIKMILGAPSNQYIKDLTKLYLRLTTYASCVNFIMSY